MNKLTGKIVVIIATLSLILSAVNLYMQLRSTAQQAEELTENIEEVQEVQDIQYVMYLGTNDKDTNEPVFSPDEAREKAKEILINHFGGYTIQEANGGWIGDDGTVYQEFTLVIYLSDTSEEDIHTAADELIKVFHQSSVLIQANQTTTEFYAGE